MTLDHALLDHPLLDHPWSFLASHWELPVLYVAASAILVTVAIRWMEKRDSPVVPVRRERNLMATASMTSLFVVAYALGVRGLGAVPLSAEALLACKLLGSVLVVGGAVLNVAARVVIGRFWSDQIEIQPGHTLVRNWPYTWMRHPMYGSLVLFGAGMSLMFRNVAVACLMVGVFLPLMVRRARREEVHLGAACGESLNEFRRAVPMILPHLPEFLARPARGVLGLLTAWAILVGQLDLAALAAVLTFGLSFVMRRADFRLAYKVKACLIGVIVALAAVWPPLAALLWLPVFSAMMSLSGHCPGTLVIRQFGGAATMRSYNPSDQSN
ncbi:MAG: isoprenylcysteine carboxylmethyltransferase family protein [Patescibacteria group bacterium]|nr:isoprenylcysteine carboxylmethyltransferase family protein [Patescibacteria group bacterium]